MPLENHKCSLISILCIYMPIIYETSLRYFILRWFDSKCFNSYKHINVITHQKNVIYILYEFDKVHTTHVEVYTFYYAFLRVFFLHIRSENWFTKLKVERVKVTFKKERSWKCILQSRGNKIVLYIYYRTNMKV